MLAMLAMAFTLVFTGCKKDDEPTPITKEKLTAVWKLESEKMVISAMGKAAPAITDQGSGETLELKSDGTTFEKDADGITATSTWSLTGTKLTIGSTSDYEGTYEVKDASNVLVLYNAVEEDMGGVKMKTETTLSFKK
jgi:hypothetical protein